VAGGRGECGRCRGFAKSGKRNARKRVIRKRADGRAPSGERFGPSVGGRWRGEGARAAGSMIDGPGGTRPDMRVNVTEADRRGGEDLRATGFTGDAAVEP